MANRTPTSDTDQTQPLAARPPTGDHADPIPAGIPGRGDGPETTTAAERPALGGSGAAGAGRPRDALGRFLPNGVVSSRTVAPPPPRVELRRITPAVMPVSVAHPDQHAMTALAEVSVRARAEHALIDADAATYLATVHRRLELGRTVLAAIRFGVEADRLEDAMAMYAGMLVRFGSGDGAA